MNLETLDSRPDPDLAAALEEFESQFQYPLGTDAWFRISHGDDYTGFFRAIGQARCFVAKRGTEVVGVISAAICKVRPPGGGFRRAAYISDLKVADSAHGITVLRLLRAATDWVLVEPTPAFCVVMDGTGQTPTAYTGRLGIPEFRQLAKLSVLRIPCSLFPSEAKDEAEIQSVDAAKSLYRRLSTHHHAGDGGDPSRRSQMTPVGLIHSNGNACGVLEDTRRCKLLFRDDGSEMVSAHLSCFGYRAPQGGLDLIAAAAGRCRELGMPALFVSVPQCDAAAILDRLPPDGIVNASATVFGYAFDEQGEWSINTAEI